MVNDLISRQAAIELIHNMYPSAPIMRRNRERWEKKYKPYIEAEKALEQLPSAQPAPQWIPVSERLPEDEDVLIQFPTNMAVGRYCGEWRINSGGDWETEVCMDDEKPIAWMPLPEPFKKM